MNLSFETSGKIKAIKQSIDSINYMQSETKYCEIENNGIEECKLLDNEYLQLIVLIKLISPNNNIDVLEKENTCLDLFNQIGKLKAYEMNIENPIEIFFSLPSYLKESSIKESYNESDILKDDVIDNDMDISLSKEYVLPCELKEIINKSDNDFLRVFPNYIFLTNEL